LILLKRSAWHRPRAVNASKRFNTKGQTIRPGFENRRVTSWQEITAAVINEQKNFEKAFVKGQTAAAALFSAGR